MGVADIDFGKRGMLFYDLVKQLKGADEGDFLLEFSEPFLLQIPINRPESLAMPGAPTRRMDEPVMPDTMSTVKFSIADMLALKRSKKHEGALIHLLRAKKDGEPVVVGRNDDCDAILRDATVSGRHAEIHHKVGNYLIVDLESQNGTFLDGIRIDANVPKPLKEKQNVWFSSYRTVFILPEHVFELASKLNG